jgi:hypothetical protein
LGAILRVCSDPPLTPNQQGLTVRGETLGFYFISWDFVVCAG